jgi:hypothetical protein
MSVLLVGCGYWGKNWAKTLATMGELAAICEPIGATREGLALQYPHAALYTDLDDALEHVGLEAVVIATPATSHYELARQANAFLAAVRGGGQAPLVNSGTCGQRVIELLAEVQTLLVQQTVSMAEPPLSPVLV